MAEQAPRASNSGIVAALTARLNELGPAAEELVALTQEVQELSIKTAKAEKVAADQAARNGALAPELVPEREHLNTTYDRRSGVFAKCTKIWVHAKKSILSLAMTSDPGHNILAQFRLLPEYPDAYEFPKCIEFLEIIVETNSPAIVVSIGDDSQTGDTKKRLRGRPIKIPEERKAEALKVFKANERKVRSRLAAEALYGTKHPSKTQRDGVSAILGAYSKKHGLQWRLPDPPQTNS